MHEELRGRVLEMNLAIEGEGLTFQTWGNASAIDRDHGVVAIKPSGVAYADLTAESIVVVDLEGRPVWGTLAPSVDLPAHLMLYKGFHDVGAIVHVHSHYATAFAQARRSLPCLGTTHADYFNGEIPLVPAPAPEETIQAYERAIGDLIVRHFVNRDPLECPAVLCAGHGPFVWGRTPRQAVENAIVLEELAALAFHTLILNPGAVPLETHLLNKHFLRKHGKDAYYGQKG
ncbi:MAG: L-ribulose-5-phosphate 4-epimerase AraD [Candidatus Hydrogenedentes bacterium]|nr:L-ribulose-5-phosphate 4-epimerase AraD [Candidatus Hydrogenedentota bacterium]